MVKLVRALGRSFVKKSGDVAFERRFVVEIAGVA